MAVALRGAMSLQNIYAEERCITVSHGVPGALRIGAGEEDETVE